MSDFYNEWKIKRTRKDHQCFECQTIIPAGSACLGWSSLYMGDFHAGWMHEDCAKASAHYRQENQLEGEPWHGLREDACVVGEAERRSMKELLSDWPMVIERVLAGIAA